MNKYCDIIKCHDDDMKIIIIKVTYKCQQKTVLPQIVFKLLKLNCLYFFPIVSHKFVVNTPFCSFFPPSRQPNLYQQNVSVTRTV